MVKVKIAPIVSAQLEFHHHAKQLQGELELTRNAMEKVPKSAGFHGQTQKHMTTYVQAVHSNGAELLIANLNTLDKAFAQLLSQFASSVDPDRKAELNSEQLTQIKSRLTSLANDLPRVTQKANQGVNEAQGIVACSRLNNTAQNTAQGAIMRLQTTITALNNFNSMATSSKIKNLKDDMRVAKGIISRASEHPVGSFSQADLAAAVDLKSVTSLTERFGKKTKATKIEATSLSGVSAKDKKGKSYTFAEFLEDAKPIWDKIRFTGVQLGKVLKGARITRLSNGTLVIRSIEHSKDYSKLSKYLQRFKRLKASAKLEVLDSLTGANHLLKSGHKFTRITKNGISMGLTKENGKLMDELNIFTHDSIMRDSKKGFDNVGKALRGGAKSGLKEGLKSIGGLKDVVDDLKGLKYVKGLGKFVPGISVVADTANIYEGFHESTELADKDHLKGGQVVASQIGGAAVDVGKVAAVTAAAGAATTVAAGFLVTAPVWATVGVGAVAAIAVNEVFDQVHLGEKLKHGWNSLVKGVSGWFN